MKRILYVEPFHGGSHAAFGHTLCEQVEADWTCLTLPGRHWEWRARGSAVYFALEHAETLRQPYDLVIASAYLPLTELYALAPALQGVPSLLYFHENQLAYPVQDPRERDHHFGFSQLVNALAATRCAFNSQWNLDSFLDEGARLLARMPDAVPSGWIEAIRAKSVVLPVPLLLEPEPVASARERLPIILWNHRWEYDKAPELFFGALRSLMDAGVDFGVIVCGPRFRRAPKVFDEARAWLGERVLHWGTAPTRAEYVALLQQADVAVSTAIHEFFGISMLEATWFGARPVVPDRLSYPEIFPAEFRWKEGGLVEHLRAVLGEGDLRADRRALVAPYGAPLLERYTELIETL